MPDSGNRSDDGSALGQGDAFLRELAQAPDKTLPSPRAGGEGDPERLSHFTVLGRIGQGGMGIVYRARDEKLGRTVALKVLPREFESDDTRRNRFIREARAAAAITHPNIVTVYEIGESLGRIFIAMELVEGQSLRALMSEGPLSAPTALQLMLQIAAGVAKAHELGIVHRDLKPENTLVTADRQVKVLDFGLAKQPAGDGLLVTGTGEGMILGTPAYMAPEQMHGMAATPASDVFALGITLYELLTTKRPFTGKNLPQLVRSIERDVPSAPSSTNPLVPGAFDAIVARCLAKAPADRYHDAGAFLADLRQLEAAASRASLESTAEQPIVANSLVTPAPSSKVAGSLRRRAGTWKLISALIVIVASVGVVAWWRARSTSAPAPTPAAASAAPAPSVMRIIDLPLPSTTVPEALAEYRQGLQLIQDDSWEQADAHFLHAAQLDPTMVEAHLRTALCGQRQAIARVELAKAVSLRAQLSERDRAILDAVEPMVGRSDPDWDEGLHRLRAASERYPGDVEFLLQLGSSYLSAGQVEQAMAIGRRITELDPLDANGWEFIADAAGELGDLETERSAAERCAATSVESSDCIARLAMIEDRLGHCEQMESLARRQADLAPLWGSSMLLEAMRAMGRPESALRVVFERQLANEPAERRQWFEGDYETRLALDHGRFDRAIDLLDGLEKTVAASDALRTDPANRKHLLITRMNVLLQTGEAAHARSVAGEILDAFESPAAAADMQYAAIAGRPLEPLRTSWVQEAFGRGGLGAWVWLNAWARPALTADDARAALAAIEHEPRMSLPRLGGNDNGWPDSDTATGHVLVLAGRAEDALPYLRSAVQSCGNHAVSLGFVLSHLELGRALELTGDATAACDAYAQVLARWGHATPRSVSADAARARATKLNCAL